MALSAKQRQAFLAMARRRTRPGSGSRPDALRESAPEYGGAIVGTYQGTVRFVIVGGLATHLYMPARMTVDVDILILRDDLPEAETALDTARAVKLGARAIGGSTWRLPTNHCLDVIAVDEPWVDAALARPVTGPDGQPYVALPYLVLMKLASGRVQDLADISRMLGAATPEQVRKTEQVVKRYRPQDVEDLASLVALGRLEYE